MLLPQTPGSSEWLAEIYTHPYNAAFFRAHCQLPEAIR